MMIDPSPLHPLTRREPGTVERWDVLPWLASSVWTRRYDEPIPGRGKTFTAYHAIPRAIVTSVVRTGGLMRSSALLRLPYLFAANADRDVENWSRFYEAGWDQRR